MLPEYPIAQVISHAVRMDERGSFLPGYDAATSPIASMHRPWQLHNVTSSRPGCLRGMHYQEPHAQAKLITVTQGAIQDVIVDLREGSPTRLGVFSFTLESGGQNQLFIPSGFAHGFLVLGTSIAEVSYLADAPYSPSTEKCFAWDSPTLVDVWKMRPQILSPRDSDAAKLHALHTGTQEV